jgi:hypothetical protein
MIKTFTKRNTLFIALLLCLSVPSFATTYTFDGAGFIGNNFHEPGSWVGGSVPPNPLPAGDDIMITAICDLVPNIFLPGSGNYSNNGTITINASAFFSIYGTLTNNSSGIILNDGWFTAEAGAYTGTIENYGEITNNFNMICNYQINNYGPSGTITNWDNYNNQLGGVTTNNATFINEGTVTNSNTMYNYGTFTNVFTIDNNGNLHNEAGAGVEIDNQGTINNTGTIWNNALLTVPATGYINNQNILSNFSTGAITNGNLISNNSLIYNSGTITNDAIGNITNTTTGTINNLNTATSFITNFGVILNDGNFNNEKIFGNTSSATFTNNNMVSNLATGLFTNNGQLDNNSNLENFGTLNNSTATAYIENNNDIYNYGTLNNSANINNNVPGAIYHQ